MGSTGAQREGAPDVGGTRPFGYPILPTRPCGEKSLGCGGNGSTAGPSMTAPSGAKREPWQGQSQVDSAVFQLTMQPR